MKYILTFFSLLIMVFGLKAQVLENKISALSGSAVNESEAHIAINPSDTNQIAVGYMHTDASGLMFKVHTTNDGGNSWTQSSFNGLNLTSTVVSSSYLVAGGGDIILAYDKNGKLYTSWIYLLYNPIADTALFAGFWASSNNNGNSFSFESTSGQNHYFGLGALVNGLSDIANIYQGVCDRQWMAVDHSNGPNQNKLYIGFVNYTNTFSGLKFRQKATSSNFFDPLFNVVAGDYQLSNIAVDKNGLIHYTAASIGNGNDKIVHFSSTSGTTFSPPHTVANALNTFPNSYYFNERENAAPSLAIAGDNSLHVTWTSFPLGLPSKCYYARSTDGGITWSIPFDINNALGTQGTIYANVSASGEKISISVYGYNTQKVTNYYVLSSPNYGNSFFAPQILSSTTSDFGNFASTDFFGDYTSSARNACRTYSVWADIRSGGQPKAYVARFNDCAPIAVQDMVKINTNFSLENVYPNPSKNDFTFKINSDKNIELQWELLDALGKKIKTDKVALIKGKQQFSISVDNLATGNYFIFLKDETGNQIVEKLIKE